MQVGFRQRPHCRAVSTDFCLWGAGRGRGGAQGHMATQAAGRGAGQMPARRRNPRADARPRARGGWEQVQRSERKGRGRGVQSGLRGGGWSSGRLCALPRGGWPGPGVHSVGETSLCPSLACDAEQRCSRSTSVVIGTVWGAVRPGSRDRAPCLLSRVLMDVSSHRLLNVSLFFDVSEPRNCILMHPPNANP